VRDVVSDRFKDEAHQNFEEVSPFAPDWSCRTLQPLFNRYKSLSLSLARSFSPPSSISALEGLNHSVTQGPNEIKRLSCATQMSYSHLQECNAV
jgi:hypothetical protein